MIIINYLNQNGTGQLSPPAAGEGEGGLAGGDTSRPGWFLDVSGDGAVTPQDVLNIINVLNSYSAGGGIGGEGEASGEASSAGGIQDLARTASQSATTDLLSHRSMVTDLAPPVHELYTRVVVDHRRSTNEVDELARQPVTQGSPPTESREASQVARGAGSSASAFDDLDAVGLGLEEAVAEIVADIDTFAREDATDRLFGAL